MHVTQIIDDQLLKYPISRNDCDLDYLDYLSKKYADYITLLKSISTSDTISKRIRRNIPKCERICRSIEKCITEMYRGKPSVAFDCFSHCINSNIAPFRHFYSVPISRKDERVQRLFRIRRSKKDIVSRKEMFHIPAELRYKVDTQRFSIPGVPCLYFGSTVYIAWCELDQPDFSEINVSRFAARRSIRVVNFAYNSLVMKQNLISVLASRQPANVKPLADLVVAWFLFWPLVFACSVRRKNPGEAFSPEYIIPQFLLQFVSLDKKEKIDGIRYLSTKYDKFENEVIFPSCWAFPAKKLHTKGHCSHLQGLFDFTEALPWRIAHATKQPHNPLNAMKVGHKRSFVNGVFVDYCTTDFGIIEGMLDEMTPTKM